MVEGSTCFDYVMLDKNKSKPIIYVDEDNNCIDRIFNEKVFGVKQYNSAMDPHVNNPEYAVNVFNSSSVAMVAIFANNIIVPVTEKLNLKEYQFNATKDTRYRQNGGLTVVERYKFKPKSEEMARKYAQHYLKSKFTNTSQFLDWDMLAEKIVTHFNKGKLSQNLEIRIVNNYAISDIVTSENVYLPSSNICISTDVNDLSSHAHPASDKSKNIEFINNYLTNTKGIVLSIDYIDNDSDKPLYTNILNKVVTLKPRKSTTNENSIKVSMGKNKHIVNKINLDKSNMNEHMIYDNPEQALHNLNKEQMLDHEKNKLEKLKIEQQLKDLDIKYQMTAKQLEIETIKNKNSEKRNKHDILMAQYKTTGAVLGTVGLLLGFYKTIKG